MHYSLPDEGLSVSRARMRRAASLRVIILFVGGAVLVSSLLYTIYFFLFGSWQTLAYGIVIGLSLFCTLGAWRRLQREQFDAAGYWLAATLILAYGAGVVFWANATVYLAVGGALLLVLGSSVAFPRRWGTWLGLTALYLLIVLVLHQLDLFPRYDVTESPHLRPYVLGITLLAGALSLGQVLHTFRAATIRNRLIVAFMVMVLLPTMGIILTSVMVNVQYGQRQVIDQLNSVAVLKEAEIDAWVRGLRTELDAVWMGEGIGAYTETLLRGTFSLPEQLSAHQNMQERLRRLVVQRPFFDELFLMDRTGEVVVSTDNSQEGKNYTLWSYFQLGLKGFYVQPPAESPLGDDMLVVASRPVADEDGEVLGVLAGRANMNRLNEIMMERAGLGETGETYLLDASYIPLTMIRFEGSADNVSTEGARSAIRGRENGSGLYDGYRGMPVVGVYRWLPQLQIALLAEQDQTEAFQAVYTSLKISIVVSIIAALLSAMLGLVLARRVTEPLSNLTEIATKIAGGDLEQIAEVGREDEFGSLAQAFNRMTEQLRDMLRDEHEERERLERVVQEYVDYMTGVRRGDLTARLLASDDCRDAEDPLRLLGACLDETVADLQDMIRRVRTAAHELSSAGAEILAVTTQQASGASQQSASIAQTTTTVDELKTIAEQSVARAQEVADGARRTVEVSQTGRRAVNDTVTSMAQIRAKVEGIAENILTLSEQTQQIGEIIATVNDIAAQSNMLALNASVEAARAGEYGKGFAVVAVEVRNLAEQSKQATAQVRAILSDIQKATNATVMATEEGTKRVEDGVQLAEQAGAAIEQLALVIEESAQAATQMVAGGRQQAGGVEQVAVAMQSINQATAQSLAGTRQAEKAAQQLNELARRLDEMVSRYRV